VACLLVGPIASRLEESGDFLSGPNVDVVTSSANALHCGVSNQQQLRQHTATHGHNGKATKVVSA